MASTFATGGTRTAKRPERLARPPHRRMMRVVASGFTSDPRNEPEWKVQSFTQWEDQARIWALDLPAPVSPSQNKHTRNSCGPILVQSDLGFASPCPGLDAPEPRSPRSRGRGGALWVVRTGAFSLASRPVLRFERAFWTDLGLIGPIWNGSWTEIGLALASLEARNRDFAGIARRNHRHGQPVRDLAGINPIRETSSLSTLTSKQGTETGIQREGGSTQES